MGRPNLPPLEKQRRLVARLFEKCCELERQLVDESGHSADDIHSTLLLSTYNQRLGLARSIARYEKDGEKDSAKSVRQTLNLFRPLGLTEQEWISLPLQDRKLAPGKPKMPKELELARIEIERDLEVMKLREIEAQYGEAPSDIDALRIIHGSPQMGRPARDLLGVLDRQHNIAVSKLRDFIHSGGNVNSTESGMGRPKKSYEERLEHFTGIIDFCRAEIAAGESKLNLVDLQLRYLKRIRDRATRIRLQIKTKSGPALLALKKDLSLVEDQILVEAGLLNDYQDNYITMPDAQLKSLRDSLALKISAFDLLERTNNA